MSPLEILNPALYHDRTVQDWHRRVFGPAAWAIDIDLMGACHRCRRGLYLLEASTNRDKATTILRRLAADAKVPAFLVLHEAGEITGARSLTGTPVVHRGEREVFEVLRQLRWAHLEAEHGVSA